MKQTVASANYIIECVDSWLRIRGLPTYSETIKELEALKIRCDGDEGVKADGSNISTYAASALLAKYEAGVA